MSNWWSDAGSTNKFDLSRMEEEDNRTQASSIPSGFPDVYVNGEDVTVTVDPTHNAMWVRDDVVGARHARTVARGALIDHEGVMRVQHLIDRIGVPRDTFIPTSVHLDNSDKYTTHCVANSTRGARIGHHDDFGKLPIISTLIWEDKLADKPDWLVEREMWVEGHYNRIFDCRGMCR